MDFATLKRYINPQEETLQNKRHNQAICSKSSAKIARMIDFRQVPGK